MNIKDYTKKELKEMQNFIPKEDFYSIVIIPMGYKHDSGYECMSYILLNKFNKIVGKLYGGSDVIHINGIGGYGYNFKTLIKPINWKIDCLPKSHLLRLFCDKPLKYYGAGLSDFSIYVEE